MYREIRNIKRDVESVLQVSHDARNSDRALILQVWAECGLVLDEKQREIWRNLPSSESIRRTRQKFQECGEYLADKEVQEGREVERKNMEIEHLRERRCKDCGGIAVYDEFFCTEHL